MGFPIIYGYVLAVEGLTPGAAATPIAPSTQFISIYVRQRVWTKPLLAHII